MKLYKGKYYFDNQILISELRFLPCEEDGSGWWAVFSKENRPGFPVTMTQWFRTREEASEGLVKSLKNTPLISNNGSPLPRGCLEMSLKQCRLSSLAKRRIEDPQNTYKCIGEFHDGYYECNEYVSPWTKSGSDVNADIMVIGQDWCGENLLTNNPPDFQLKTKGFDDKFSTNSNLDRLLQDRLSVRRSQCYVTNVFPFVKSGNASAKIKMADLKKYAIKYTRKEIEIVEPKFVICLGQRTFIAMMRAFGMRGWPKIPVAIENPFEADGRIFFCVAHTGWSGMANRGREQVEKDWEKIADRYRII